MNGLRRYEKVLLFAAAVFIVAAIVLAFGGCASLGLGAPVGRPLPLAVKPAGELGTCASSGYEVDIPPHATVATVASVCVRPWDGSAGDASAPPSSIPPPPLSIQRPSFPTAPSSAVGVTAADVLVRELEGGVR